MAIQALGAFGTAWVAGMFATYIMLGSKASAVRLVIGLLAMGAVVGALMAPWDLGAGPFTTVLFAGLVGSLFNMVSYPLLFMRRGSTR